MNQNKRLHYLDSIRGIAACMVLFMHCWFSLPDNFLAAHSAISSAFTSAPNFLWYVAGKFLAAGRSAVMIFFVLSGFVLAYSLLMRQTPYIEYAARRIFRIYPAFLFAILASYFLHLFIGTRHLTNSTFFNEILIGINPPFLLAHLAMWGTHDSIKLDGVIWSLVHEMRISLIFPFILALAVKWSWRSLYLWGALSIICTVGMFWWTGRIARGYEETTFLQSYVATAYFIVFFAAGACLALDMDRIARLAAQLKRWRKWCILVLIIGCFIKIDNGNYSLFSIVIEYLHGAAALGLISLALGLEKFGRALSHGILLWLGRISYSLYLIHFPVMYAFNQTVGVALSPIASFVCSIALALLTAHLMARYVEIPGIGLGKRLVITR